MDALDVLVGTVAHRLAACVLAPAEIDFGRRSGGVFLWRKTGVAVATIAKRLALAPTATAPIVVFPGLDIDGKGPLLSDDNLGHRVS
jgi:hypothetical protein